MKPANIFLAETERGERLVKLLDFGIAKVLPGASAAAAPAPLALPTEVGTTLGTPRYLSPEQARGLPVDHRTDLYSVGAVLYAMLTGRDPFAHVEGIAAVLRAHVFEPPRPPSFVAAQHIPGALDGIVLKALSKNPADRYASAADFAAALEGVPAPQPAGHWAETERMDVAVFQGAGRRAPGRPLPDKTEPVDVSIFSGALRARAPALPLAAPVSPWGAAPQAAPETVRRSAGGTRAKAVGVVFVAVLAAVSLLAMLLAVASK